MKGLTQVIISKFSRQLWLHGKPLGTVTVFKSGINAYYGRVHRGFKSLDEAAGWLVEMRRKAKAKC